MLAHPLAAEALVAALEQLSRTAPRPDTAFLVGELVFTLERVYRVCL